MFVCFNIEARVGCLGVWAFACKLLTIVLVGIMGERGDGKLRERTTHTATQTKRNKHTYQHPMNNTHAARKLTLNAPTTKPISKPNGKHTAITHTHTQHNNKTPSNGLSITQRSHTRRRVIILNIYGAHTRIMSNILHWANY